MRVCLVDCTKGHEEGSFTDKLQIVIDKYVYHRRGYSETIQCWNKIPANFDGSRFDIIIISGSQYMINNEGIGCRAPATTIAFLHKIFEMYKTGRILKSPMLFCICFGFQVLLEYFGARIERMPGTGHPRKKIDLFIDTEQSSWMSYATNSKNNIAHYKVFEHHLDRVITSTIPPNFTITGIMGNSDGGFEPASVEHQSFPITGVQFHIGDDSHKLLAGLLNVIKSDYTNSDWSTY